MTKSPSLGIKENCVKHNSDIIAWCKDCKVPICLQGLYIDHKSCDWVSTDDRTAHLISSLKESITSTRTKLNDKFKEKKDEHHLLEAELHKNIKKYENYAKVVSLFIKDLKAKEENANNTLNKYENIPTNSSVTKLTTAITETLSLLDDPMTGPKIPKLVELHCEDPPVVPSQDVLNKTASAVSDTGNSKPPKSMKSPCEVRVNDTDSDGDDYLPNIGGFSAGVSSAGISTAAISTAGISSAAISSAGIAGGSRIVSNEKFTWVSNISVSHL